MTIFQRFFVLSISKTETIESKEANEIGNVDIDAKDESAVNEESKATKDDDDKDEDGRKDNKDKNNEDNDNDDDADNDDDVINSSEEVNNAHDDDNELENAETNEKSADQMNGKNVSNISVSTSNNESFHSACDDKSDSKIANEADIDHDAEPKRNRSESRVSTPVQKLEKSDRKERRAVSVSPILLPSKTNGTSKKNSSPMTLPTNPDDLFDLLKSNNLPEPSGATRHTPSPTRGLSDDEDEADATAEVEKSNPSPVPDLHDESGSANDSRFSLNTFFKSMKDKLISKQSGNDSPSRSSPKEDDDLSVKNADGNLDSPTAQEITTQ